MLLGGGKKKKEEENIYVLLCLQPASTVVLEVACAISLLQQ